MKHPPSKTIGKKYWLAKAWPNSPLDACCPDPEIQIKNGTYSFSPANFDPRKLNLPQARIVGKKTTLFPPYGAIFGAQIWRMAHEAKIGDVVFLESNNKHLYAWGEIISGYKHKSLESQNLTSLKNEGLHSIGVQWHPIKKGLNSFKSGKGDSLLFREITQRLDLIERLKPFIQGTHYENSECSNEPQDLEYTEGNKVLRTHLRTERNPKATKLAKEFARKKSKSGKLTCEACGGIPEDDYEGADLIEAHHRIPLSRGARETKPEDFAMLCPCCHRAVHKLINSDVDHFEALKHITRIFA